MGIRHAYLPVWPAARPLLYDGAALTPVKRNAELKPVGTLGHA
jgi:hypothetical protein